MHQKKVLILLLTPGLTVAKLAVVDMIIGTSLMRRFLLVMLYAGLLKMAVEERELLVPAASSFKCVASPIRGVLIFPIQSLGAPCFLQLVVLCRSIRLNCG